MKRFAISDIHGCAKTFTALLEKTGLQKEDHLYLLGDYIDRGTDSRGVINKILELKKEGYQVTSLLGNHEWMLLNSMNDYKKFDNWMKNGGSITLDSYKILELDYFKKLPYDHLEFFRSLEYYVELEDYYLVHAGFNFKDDDPFNDYESMIWIREWHKNIDTALLNGKKIVHGHVPRVVTNLFADVKNPDVQAYDIDTGCVYDSSNRLGVLSALNLDDMSVITHNNIDR